MNLPDLSKVDLNAARPPEGMTDEEWQKYFKTMKMLVQQSSDRRMKEGKSFTVKGSTLNSQSSYCGETQWQRYCQFINSVLNTIRCGELDYCYNIYQITDLLKYEHDRLAAQWQPENKCFQVWLA